MKALSRWESNFHSAVYSDYSRPLGKNEIDFMRDLYKEAQGDDVRVNISCSKCVLDFLKRMGSWYYQSKGKEGEDIKQTKEETAHRIQKNANENRVYRASKKN